MALALPCISACGSGPSGSSSSASTATQQDTSTDDTSTPLPSPEIPMTVQTPDTGFVTETEVLLAADGTSSPENTYSLIEAVFGEGSIEAPDFFSNDHTAIPHIIEENDTWVGNHFVFLAHRDLDFNKGVESDRQRNEIKSYDKSAAPLKGFEGETMQFEWFFFVSSEMSLTSKFSHFFQLKARNNSEDNSNGNDEQPVLTLSGVEKDSSGQELQVRHSTGNTEEGQRTDDVYLVRANWTDITDEWVKVFVQATFAEDGQLIMQLTRLRDHAVIIDIHENNIDMWRGVSEQDFIRPKWGIYRSTAQWDQLRAEEERVKFADFVVRKGRAN
ncbi:hypothetical protein GTH32_08060 [Alteromonas sp. 345S023]|uniref:Polysaccharide lyase family 7 protein n=1 Tax=Alteromonas profundi TaxID=2696062 RepID=A0A7X5LKS4_9ALTE|nr:hypothetical protein [Alteromonas profundi]